LCAASSSWNAATLSGVLPFLRACEHLFVNVRGCWLRDGVVPVRMFLQCEAMVRFLYGGRGGVGLHAEQRVAARAGVRRGSGGDVGVHTVCGPL